MSKPTILFVALPYSIHTARWIAQLNDAGYDIHLFPSLVTPVHPKITALTIHYGWQHQHLSANCVHQKNLNYWLERILSIVLQRVRHSLLMAWQARQLAKLIQELQPDVIHAMEMQAAGYLTLAAKKLTNSQFPPWIMGAWGNDIYWFGRFPEHQDKIRQVLANCDYFFCDCQRDVPLAKKFGFNKTMLPVYPAVGGFDLVNLLSLHDKIKSSKRTIIALKGYQTYRGRALIGLRALQQCIDELQGFEIHIYGASSSIVNAARLFSKETGIATRILPNDSPYTDILALHSISRISIGLSLSDGLSVSLLDAMVMGSFPIQSCTACADEWIEHGVSGAIVPPEDPEIVAMWIRKALADDELVNRAAELNWQTALARLDSEQLKQQTIDMYQTVMNQ